MQKFVKFAITGKGDYYLPVGSGTTASYGADTDGMFIGVEGNVLMVAHATDSAGANVIGLQKAIYDVLADSQLQVVTWTPAQAVSGIVHDLLA
tara:strand:- start:581 stop:859 length:279 start_codon:yes stop_codon:yes gene_type:complete